MASWFNTKNEELLVRAELANLRQEFQRCRENKHQWRDHNVIEHTRDKAIEQVQVCAVCGNERWRLLSLRKSTYGHRLTKWHIRYTDKSYLFPKGVAGELTEDDYGELRMQLLGFGGSL
jgi:hypothetical protein